MQGDPLALLELGINDLRSDVTRSDGSFVLPAKADRQSVVWVNNETVACLDPYRGPPGRPAELVVDDCARLVLKLSSNHTALLTTVRDVLGAPRAVCRGEDPKCTLPAGLYAVRVLTSRGSLLESDVSMPLSGEVQLSLE